MRVIVGLIGLFAMMLLTYHVYTLLKGDSQ